MARLFAAYAFVIAAALASVSTATLDLPSALTDQEFWQLVDDLSEPGGTFQSDNLTSNELVFPMMAPALAEHTRPGRVYPGVGPEQNFTYIALTTPRMAFITDIRRGNLQLQLMYKAIFELSADRAEFVSRLFTKKRPPGLTASSSVAELMNAYWDIFTDDETAYAANLKAIEDQLMRTHGLPLSQDDLDGIARVYRAFYWYGPLIHYGASVALRPVTSNGGANYSLLMTQTGTNGEALSFLASEEKYAYVKTLESRNLVVPIVGDFAGPKALRAVGRYIREHGAIVSAFYVSNVEMYLMRDGSWATFCGNVATLPVDEFSVLIRPFGPTSLNGGLGVLPIPPIVKSCGVPLR